MGESIIYHLNLFFNALSIGEGSVLLNYLVYSISSQSELCLIFFSLSLWGMDLMMCVIYLLINAKDTILDMFNIIASNAESDS